MVGANSEGNVAHLVTARGIIGAAGLTADAEIRQGEVESALHAYQAEHGIDLLVMGAYGHSRIRQFLIDSTTTTMLRTTTIPVLLLR